LHEEGRYRVATGMTNLIAKPITSSVFLLRKMCTWNLMQYVESALLAKIPDGLVLCRLAHRANATPPTIILKSPASGLTPALKTLLLLALNLLCGENYTKINYFKGDLICGGFYHKQKYFNKRVEVMSAADYDLVFCWK
jgi:hypothetical protein